MKYFGGTISNVQDRNGRASVKNANWMTLMVLVGTSTTASGFVAGAIPPRRSLSFQPDDSITKVAATSLELGEAIVGFYTQQPYLSAFLTCSVKAGTADAIVQTKGSRFDQARNLAFVCYGGLYQGIVQQFIFGEVYPEVFGTDGSWQSVAMQVGTEMTLLAPFLCLPLAYVATSLFEGNNDNDVCHHGPSSGTIGFRRNHHDNDSLRDMFDDSILQPFHRAMSRYTSDIQSKHLLLKYWALWVPVNSVTFAIIPIHFRVAFVACISFLWVMILSSISDETNG